MPADKNGSRLQVSQLMTSQDEKPTLVRKIVVVFDICSSTTMLEDLKSTDNLDEWRNLLIDLKGFLLQKSAELHFEPYKFIGDGWILLFPPNISKSDLLRFLCDLKQAFYGCFDESVGDLLQRTPKVLGITVGVDSGELIRVQMNEQIEYLGRALNVASRLQGATKELSSGPSNKALFSRNSFNSMHGRESREFKLISATVELRNIINGQNYECFEWEILR